MTTSRLWQLALPLLIIASLRYNSRSLSIVTVDPDFGQYGLVAPTHEVVPNLGVHDEGHVNSNNNVDDDGDDGRRAVFIISMGKAAARTRLVERFVYSARTAGEYKGWIVLLTDAPSQRYENIKSWNYTRSDEQLHSSMPALSGDDRFLVMSPKSEHYNTDLKYFEMTIKRFKTWVLDYVGMDERLDKVSLVYYLDVDIVFTDSLPVVFEGLEEKYKIVANTSESPSTVATRSKIWMFEGNFKETPIQGGQMILDRKDSGGCLDMWREMIDASPKNLQDQVALMGMWKIQQDNQQDKERASHCHIVKMDQEPYISFPTSTDAKQRVVKILGQTIKNGNPTTVSHRYANMVHVRNTGKVTHVLNETYHQIWVRDMLHMQPDDEDPLGLTKPGKMKALKIDSRQARKKARRRRRRSRSIDNIT